MHFLFERSPLFSGQYLFLNSYALSKKSFSKYYYDKNCCWLLDENSEDFEDKMINILQDIYNSDVLLINKQNNLIRLNKKNTIDNFMEHILNKDGFTDK